MKSHFFRYYGWYSVSFILFVLLLAVAEQFGLPQQVIGHLFLLSTIILYASIGVMNRTTEVAEYYVAGRQIPAVFNGMATAADWMSAASFIGLAGALYFAGFDGLAFITGWTGGFVLVAVLLAPYLRKFGQYTIPDFLGARYEGNLARLIGVAATVLTSFVYLVAQLYAVGLVTSRFIGIHFEIGIFVGLAGILVCSLLGGMRAITWTQAAQFLVLMIAYMVPVTIISYKLTDIPVPQIAYGSLLQNLDRLETDLIQMPAEISARSLYQARAEEYSQKIAALPESLISEREYLHEQLNQLHERDAPARELAQLGHALRDLPDTPQQARSDWEKARDEALAHTYPPAHHVAAYRAQDGGSSAVARNNFLALMFVLMVGTAALPHVLVRYYTTPSVVEARRSVFWAVFFIFLLYITAPAYAVFAKWEVYTRLVGSSITELPSWIHAWSRIGLIKIDDINQDGTLQLAELTLNPDIIFLMTPELAGLPYVLSGLVAAGGFAAALSTANGLLFTLSNAFSHDLYYKIINPKASTHHRLVVSKGLLLIVAMIAAWVASLKPDSILFLVGLAFSFGASAFFPALVLGIFWKRTNRSGAVAGMLTGLGITLYYVIQTHPFFGGSMSQAWFGIRPISAGLFGVLTGFAITIIVSLLTPPPPQKIQNLVDYVRYPYLTK